MTDPKDRQAPDWLNELRDEVMTLEHRGSSWVLAEEYRALQKSIPALIAEAVEAVEAAEAENERLREENASLWERVKRWEPGADPAQFGSGCLPIRHQGEGDSTDG